MIESGQIILQYQTKRPFRLSSDERVGFSGIMFEQAMFGLLHEYRKSTSTPLSLYSPLFTGYHGRGQSFPFEPTPSGFFLETSGQPTYPDYINDMRQFLGNDGTNSIFSHISISDSDYSANEAKAGYHLAYFGNTPSGKIRGVGPSTYNSGNFNYPYYNVNDIPPTGNGAFLGYLGCSGSLLDLDFDEVQYQPYPRFGKSRYSGLAIGDSPNYFLHRLISPIYPAFCKTDGSLIHLTTSDIAYKFFAHDGSTPSELDLYGDQSFIPSGYIRIDGDTLDPHNTTFKFINSSNPVFSIKSSGLRTISQVFRPIYKPGMGSGQIIGSRGFFTPSGGLTSGLYQVALMHTSLPSGTLGIWPSIFVPISGVTQTLSAGIPLLKSIMCFNVTDNIMWAKSASGIMGYSPFNGIPLWNRIPVTQSDIDKSWNFTGPFSKQGIVFRSADFAYIVNAVLYDGGNFAWAVQKFTYADLDWSSSGVAAPSAPNSSGFATHSYKVTEDKDGKILVMQKQIGREALLHIINPSTFTFETTIGGDPANTVLNDGGAVTDSKMLGIGFVGSNEYGLIGTPEGLPEPVNFSGIGQITRPPLPPLSVPFTIDVIKPVLYNGSMVGFITALFSDSDGNAYITVDKSDADFFSRVYIYRIIEDTNNWNVVQVLPTHIYNGINPRDYGVDGTRIHVHRTI